ncbi:MAG TPA: serine/threonine-protein kinase [Gemmatimonadales bacterium]
MIDLAPADRDAALDQLTTDAELRAEVAAVLARAEAHTSPLDSGALPQRAPPATAAAALIGERIGPYTVVRLVGIGGMGAVYEAARADDEYHKRVAIKVVQRGIDSDVTLARFRRERQILASLDHPNIATLHDGGVMADGRPFLVMEYVDGGPITTWCNERSLPLRERLTLFRQVCAAVHHAHRNLVIHRDLKPANILVTHDGTVKLLDFGIAQLVADDGADAADAMPLTRGGVRACTPEYASPEQIRGQVLTTASDIYSLGVVLFELLTGSRPHVVASHALVDIERAVLETPVPRPSTVITGHASAALGAQPLARARQRLRGDLDSIALMALRPEPARRYPSAEALGEDVQHHLDARPVRAQPDWLGYRAAKFVRRNRAVTLISLLAVVALLAGVAITTTEAQRARVAATRATQANLFLTQLLASVHPETGSRDAKVSDVLDAAATRVAHEFARAPDIRADLESVIGESYDGLGRYDDAERHLKAALALRQQTAGADSRAATQDVRKLGRLYLDQGVLDSAGDCFRRALATEEAHHWTGDELYAGSLSDLGSLAHMQGHAAEGERYHRQALALRLRIDGPESDQVAIALTDVGVTVGEQGRLAEAEALHRQALAIVRRNNPQPNERVAGVLATLAGVLDLEGKTAAADSAYRETLALRKAVLGPQHPDYALTLFNYSGFVFDQHRYQEAASYAREILALRGTALPESHPAVAAALQTLGRSLDQLGDHVQASAALTESLDLRRRYNSPDSWVIASGESILGEHYTLVKDYRRAEPLLLDAAGRYQRVIAPADYRNQANRQRLAALYLAWGRPDQAARYTTP